MISLSPAPSRTSTYITQMHAPHACDPFVAVTRRVEITTTSSNTPHSCLAAPEAPYFLRGFCFPVRPTYLEGPWRSSLVRESHHGWHGSTILYHSQGAAQESRWDKKERKRRRWDLGCIGKCHISYSDRYNNNRACHGLEVCAGPSAWRHNHKTCCPRVEACRCRLNIGEPVAVRRQLRRRRTESGSHHTLPTILPTAERALTVVEHRGPRSWRVPCTPPLPVAETIVSPPPSCSARPLILVLLLTSPHQSPARLGPSSAVVHPHLRNPNLPWVPSFVIHTRTGFSLPSAGRPPNYPFCQSQIAIGKRSHFYANKGSFDS